MASQTHAPPPVKQLCFSSSVTPSNSKQGAQQNVHFKKSSDQGRPKDTSQTLTNSVIQGRKVESPKIFVVTDRPLTSTQVTRKSTSSQNATAPIAFPQKKAKRGQEAAELCTATLVQPHSFFMSQGPKTKKDQSCKFDFAFNASSKEQSTKSKAAKQSFLKAQNQFTKDFIKFDDLHQPPRTTTNCSAHVLNNSGPISLPLSRQKVGQLCPSGPSAYQQKRQQVKGKDQSLNSNVTGQMKTQATPTNAPIPPKKRVKSENRTNQSSIAAARKTTLKKPKIAANPKAMLNKTTCFAPSTISAVQQKKLKTTTQFSFELEKENVSKLNNKSQQKSKQSFNAANRKKRVLSVGRNDLSISTLSSNKSIGTNNASGNLSKLISKKNYFVDGEKLLRQFSPDSPDNSPPRGRVENAQQLINLMNHSAPGTTSTKDKHAHSEQRTGGHRRLGKQHQFQGSDGDKSSLIDADESHIRSRAKVASKNLLSHDLNNSLDFGMSSEEETKLMFSRADKDRLAATQGQLQIQKQLTGFEMSLINANPSVDVTKHNSAKQLNLTQKSSKKEQVKGLDKLVRQNNRKKHRQDAERMLKKFMEETQKKQKKAELSQRNLEIKKLNASKVHNVDDAEKQRIQILLQKAHDKKKRSKSCIHKSENFLLPSQQPPVFKEERQNSNDTNNQQYSILAGGLFDTNKIKERSCLGQISRLKREVNNEINRELKEGLIEFAPRLPNTTTNKNAGKLALGKKKLQSRALEEQFSMTNPNPLQRSTFTSLRRGDAELVLERNNGETEGTIKSRSRKTAMVSKAVNASKIQRFIERQKKKHKALKSLERSLEHEKHRKIRQCLQELHDFTRGDRKKPSGLRQQNPASINIKKILNDPMNSSQQQLQLLEHVRNTLPRKNFKAHQNVSKAVKKHKIDLSIRHEYQKDDDMSDDPKSEEEVYYSQSYKILKQKLEGTNSFEYNENITTVKNSTLQRDLSPSKSPSRSKSGSRADHIAAPPLKELKINQTKQTKPLRDTRLLNLSQNNILSLEDSIHVDTQAKTSNKHRQASDAFTSLSKDGEGASGNTGPMGQSEFESLEPVRYAHQRQTHVSHSDPDTIHDIKEAFSPVRGDYQQHVRELTEKYSSGKSKHMSDSKMLIRLHSAAILIQFHVKKYLHKAGFYQSKGIPPFFQQEEQDSIESIPVEKPNLSISKIESNDNTSQSVRKTMIPVLDLNKLAPSKPNDALRDSRQDPGSATSRSKSIFDKTPFQDVMKGFEGLDKCNHNNYPELLRLREEAIKYREKTEGTYYKKMFSSNQISARTYDLKWKQLETWVTKEREDVKKTKKAFEAEWEKTAKLIAATQKNYEIVQSVFQDEGRTSSRLNHHATHQMSSRNGSERTGPEIKPISSRSYKNLLNSNRGPISKRGEQSKFLDLIYEQQNLPGRERLNSADETNTKQRDLLDSSSSHPVFRDQSQTSNYLDADNDVELAPETELDELATPADITQLKHLDSLGIDAAGQINFSTKNITQDLYSGKSRQSQDLKSPINLLSEPALSGDFEQNHNSFDQQVDFELLNKILKNASTEDELEQKVRPKPQKTSSAMKIEEDSSAPQNEKGLHRVLSYKQLQDQSCTDLQEQKTPIHFRRLVDQKPTRGSGNLFDDEDDLARQIMEVSPATSDRQFKNELKESLKSDNYFLNKMNSGNDYEMDLDQLFKGNDVIRVENEGQVQPKVKRGDLEIQKPVAEKELAQVGSPISADSAELGIMRGSVSLESSTSQEAKPALLKAFKEAALEPLVKEEDFEPTLATTATGGKSALGEQEPRNFGSQDFNDFLFGDQQNLNNVETLSQEQIEFGEELTDELMQLLMAEMKHEMDQTINRTGSFFEQGKILRINLLDVFRGVGQGIKTDLFAIEKYVDEVLQEIQIDTTELARALSQPLSKRSLELLNQLQNSEIGSCEHFEEKYPQVLPLDLYLVLEKRRKEKRELEIRQETRERGEMSPQQQILKTFLAECEHIHNKVLFDCINDSLLQFKPYGKEGTPVPWSRSNRRLKPSDDFQVTEIFEIVKHDLFRWAITQSGTLPRREFLYQGVFDEELFAEIREKKLVGLLAREMIETEPKWLNYEFESTQVKIDIGDMILEHLVNEAISELKTNGGRDFSKGIQNRSALESEGSKFSVKSKASPGITDKDFSLGSHSPASLLE